jgi:hypothetical protein
LYSCRPCFWVGAPVGESYPTHASSFLALVFFCSHDQAAQIIPSFVV